MIETKLRSLPNKHSDKQFVCLHEFPELTAFCPMTGLPDFYTLVIRYEPGDLLVELKSLKNYLTSYRNVGILHEELANSILENFVHAIQPHWFSIELKVNVRGGMKTVISREWRQRTRKSKSSSSSGGG
jgi:7-cyano-7-deazaguanine reductase